MKRNDIIGIGCLLAGLFLLTATAATDDRIQPEKIISSHKIIHIGYSGAVNPTTYKLTPNKGGGEHE
ncbi:MAG: hypothetical protein GY868_05005 [Deltaproteobacteria bacterium]|nr:hypothetical protein [Deltaproteobacteria bacterium]